MSIPPNDDPYTEIKYYRTAANLDLLAVGSFWSASQDLSPSSQHTLFSPSQGHNSGQRIARQTILYRIQINGLIRYPFYSAITSVPYPNLARLLLVQDKTTSGFSLNPDNVIRSSTSLASAIHSFQNGAFREKYELLTDTIIPINSNSSLFATNSLQSTGCFYPFQFDYTFNGGLLINYTSSIGSVDSIQDHGFFLMGGLHNPPTTISGVLIPNSCTIEYDCVCTFSDAQ